MGDLARAGVVEGGVVNKFGTFGVQDKSSQAKDGGNITRYYSPVLYDHVCEEGQIKVRIVGNRVEVFNINGQRVAELLESDLRQVIHQVQGAEVLPGGYVYCPTPSAAKDEQEDVECRLALIYVAYGLRPNPPAIDSRYFPRVDSGYAGRVKPTILYMHDFEEAAVFSPEGQVMRCTVDRPLKFDSELHKDRRQRIRS